MTLGTRSGGEVPPTDKRLLVAAGILILIPVVALLWVGSYTKETPRLGGFPFFFWYQLMWVFLTAILSWVAYLLIRAARRPGRPTVDGDDR
jgi:membrane protein implicated in regulation of membrane protease activity